ncbi:MAG: beta-N-acetylhexosaminidase [Spirochaetes bacterium]|nr:beta-N-acetylhexosaminidase [Spirochaetota bacterium]
MPRPIFILEPATDASLKTAFKVLAPYLPFDILEKGKGTILRFRKSGPGPRIMVDKDGVTVVYGEACQATRALGLMAAMVKAGGKIAPTSEKPDFKLLSVMLDVSRNLVLKPEMLRTLLAHYALMGINSVMLYAETTYEVKGEPYFGYLTGRYGQKELSELDAYARGLGIEMIPCIQTLAHLARALQWPAYGKVRDTTTVTMVDEEATYALVEKLLVNASAPFATKRIHIGMDEAWDLGLGNFLRKNGYQDPHGMISRHLKRVADLCQKHGLKPMMWSDMFFRAGSKTGAYYDLDVVIPPEVKKSIPKNVQLVYWDYYHFDREFYEKFIDRHAELGGAPLMASGAQTWIRLWTNYEYAFTTLRPCVEACKKKKVKEMIMTVWGDDGNEYDVVSHLPVMQAWADYAFNPTWDEKRLSRNLLGTCEMDWGLWKQAGQLDHPKGFDGPLSSNNISKILLWEDPLIGLAQPHAKGLPLRAHWAALEKKLAPWSKGKGRWDRRLAYPHQLTRVLGVKADLPARIQDAYLKKNKAALKKIIQSDLPFLLKEVEKLRELHRTSWFENGRPMGWEVLDVRYSGLLGRLSSAKGRLSDFLSGKAERLEELDEKRLLVWWTEKQRKLPTAGYTNVYASQPMPLNWGPL